MKSLEQSMLQGKEWSNFFHNIENKSDLLCLLAKYLKDEAIRQCKKTPILVNEELDTWRVLDGDSAIIFQCTQEEADTRMILHACREDTNVVVDSKDTDVLVLMIYAFTIHRPTSEWLMKIKAERYANIRKILNHFGEDLCLKLPHIHAITGCDTTSFLHGLGKVSVIKKSIKRFECLKLLDGFGDSADL